MIGYLRGTPVIQSPDLLIIVQGVGYRVKVGSATMAAAAGVTDLELHIYTHVREDALELFGFSDLSQRGMFELLLSVSGVGPRTALALSDLGSDQIVTAVQQADVQTFSSVPRVGKKLAQKIIIELKSKLGDLQDLNLGPTSNAQRDVQDALLTLGFNEREIREATSGMDFEASDTAVLVKQAIKSMTKR